MRLKELQIRRRQSYEEMPGTLVGTVEFESPKGRITVGLDEESARRVVEVCAQGIVAHTREIASNMTAEVIAQHPQLEAKVGA